MKLSAPLYQLKRQAKRMARDEGIALHAALDRIAGAQGFRSWSHLAAAAQPGPAEGVLRQLDPGDMLLVAARPGQGKTLLGLELARGAEILGRRGVFFTLDYTRREVEEHLARLPGKGEVTIDTSDEICAAYITTRLARLDRPALAVIDYLQILDQRRDTPPLADQLAALNAHAKASGAILAMISQVDRAFDASGGNLPGLRDIRMPNRFDPALFDKACFLHDGQVRMGRVG
ncbi:DNA helicase [Roseovarius sp.]|uniref:DNA helicase n=1 Tax=Roseovarius sp. TaxID=1486281 RepID=UPI00260CD0F3|nr:DNA helicase [Roseovarius sp.]MDM8165158.1 DNA helicase [Roseovarius sp.]